MVDPDEEFEPLFDYRRVQPLNYCTIDDDSDCSPAQTPKRRKVPGKSKSANIGVEVINCDEGDDDDDLLLSPSPMILVDLPKCNTEDSVIKELRKRKEELVSFTRSTHRELQPLDEDEPGEGVNSSVQSSFEHVANKSAEKKPSERAKLVISIQEKNGQQKQFRIFADDKFERLFKMYSEKVKIDLEKLAFCFDGEKVSPASSPASLDMEDEDIIEVHVKSK